MSLPTVKIGFPVPLTSVYGVEASDQVKCAELAVEEFNRDGGWQGRKVELLVRDTQHKNEVTQAAALELLDHQRVDFMVGALSAIDMMTLARICTERKKIYIGISIGDGIVSSEVRSPYVFHEGPTAFGTADSVGRYAFSHFGFRAAFLTVNSAFGPDTLRGLLQLGRDIGIEVVANELHPIGETDFRPYIQRILSTQPQVIVTTNFGGDQFHMLSQFKEFQIPVQTRLVCTSLSVVQRMKAGADVYEDVVGGTGYYWQMEDFYESTRQFNAKYFTRYGDPPASGHGAYAYGAVKSLLMALKEQDRLDNTDSIIRSLEGLRFDVCRGPQFYRRLDHQSVQPVAILRSKSRLEMASEKDLFEILEVDEFLKERSFHLCFEKK